MSWNEILDRPFFLQLSVSLLHFLWQGAAAAAIFAAGDVVLRRRRAGPRAHYGLACAALAVMAILPIVTFSRARSLGAFDGASNVRAASSESPAVPEAGRHREARLSGLASRFAEGTAGARPIFLGAWMLGVSLLSVRLLAGWRIAGRFATRATAPARAELTAAFDRLARRLDLTRPVRLLESASIHVPTVLGVLKPVVLVPVSALTGLDPKQLEALLAHELAHVRRHDYLVNLLQSAVETLLFYHPAVWWVSGRIRRERENCCDDLAVAVSGDARAYAGALVRLEERRGAGTAALVVASNGGDLFRRVARLLSAAEPGAETPSPRIAGAVALLALLFVGAAARVSTLEATTARPFSRLADSGVFPASEGVSPAAGSRGEGARGPTLVALALASAQRSSSPSQRNAATPAPAPASETEPAEGVEPATPLPDEDPAPSPAPAPSGRTVAPTLTLTSDELQSFRIHGVTPEFRSEIAAAGYANASPDDLVALRIHGVSPADIAGIQKRFGRVSLERCIEFAIHGVSPAWLEEIAAAGLSRISPDQAVAMRIHGVTPEFLRQLHDAGYRDASVDDAVSLRIHGVRPEDARAWESLGMGKPSLDALVSARIHGVDPAFARAMRAEGLTDLDMDDLTSCRIHGVTPEFVREMKATGLSSISADDAVALRIHGVTAAFLNELRSLGLSVTSADDAAALVIHGVSPRDLRDLRMLGYKDVDADDLVALRIHGISADDIRRWNREAGTRLSIDDLVDTKLEGRRFR